MFRHYLIKAVDLHVRACRISGSGSNFSLSALDSFVLAQLEELGELTARTMFGGVGLYCGGIFFGIIARDQLYLKTDSRNRADFEQAGSRPFQPYPDRPGTMQYYEVPLAVLESAPELVEWARQAVEVGRWASQRKPHTPGGHHE